MRSNILAPFRVNRCIVFNTNYLYANSLVRFALLRSVCTQPYRRVHLAKFRSNDSFEVILLLETFPDSLVLAGSPLLVWDMHCIWPFPRVEFPEILNKGRFIVGIMLVPRCPSSSPTFQRAKLIMIRQRKMSIRDPISRCPLA